MNIYHESQRKNKNEYSIFLWIWNAVESKKIEKHLKRLELEAMLKEIDCIEIMGHLYRSCGKNEIFNQCYNTYLHLNKLINDLREIMTGLNDSALSHDELNRKENDLLRYQNGIAQFREELKNNRFIRPYSMP